MADSSASARGLGGLLLAAGGSTRLGCAKQLLYFQGESLVRRGTRLLCAVADPVLVVTGADATTVAEQLAGLPASSIWNADWQEGMGGSLARGVRALPGPAAAVLVLHCDQYRITVADLERLKAAWCQDPASPVLANWGEVPGPPAIFPASWFARLAGLSGDAGARALLRESGVTARLIEMENAAFDLDQPQDLVELRRFEQGG